MTDKERAELRELMEAPMGSRPRHRAALQAFADRFPTEYEEEHKRYVAAGGERR